MKPKREYGRGQIPHSDKYVVPKPRNRFLLMGLVAGLVTVLLVWGIGVFLGSAAVVAGPVSSAHATFANDCKRCHEGSEVPNGKCETCHEEAKWTATRDTLLKADQRIPIHSFSSHYAYRTDDFRRAAKRPDEPTCGSCHREHRGSAALLTRVQDSQCVECHRDGSTEGAVRHPGVSGFDRKHHPQFAAIGRPDEASLKFNHDFHANKVANQNGFLATEQACLYCHVRRPGGASFEPISYERHCRSCHPVEGTGMMPATGSIDSPVAAVMSLGAIRQHGGPETAWARRMAPSDFSESGGGIEKSTVSHRDPWVLFNLRRLRDVLYSSGPIADLLEAAPNVAPGNTRVLYEEALQTLQARVEDMSGAVSPFELEDVRTQLAMVERRLRDPDTTFPPEPFTVDSRPRRVLTSAEQAEFDRVTGELTAGCRKCHGVERQSISRVSGDQRAFLRARFDHRKHLVQKQCLDCHGTKIPIRQVASEAEALPPERDHAAIQNLPGIDNCVACHAPGKAGTSCVTCHDFHPKKTRPSEIPLTLHE